VAADCSPKGYKYPSVGHTTSVITRMFSGFYTFAQALMYSDLHTMRRYGVNLLKNNKTFLNNFGVFNPRFGAFPALLGGS
jgi:hypothetical protein